MRTIRFGGILKSSDSKILRELLTYPGFGKIFAIVLASIALSSYLGLLIPTTMADLSRTYDDSVAYSFNLKKISVIFIAIFVVRIAYQLALNSYMLHLVQNIRSRCFSFWLLARDVSKKNSKGKEVFPLGEVIARIMNDTMAIRELMTSGTFGIIIDLFFVFACLVGLLQLNFTSGIMLVLAEVLASVFLIWGSKYMREVFHEVRNARGMVSRQLANVVGGFKEAYFYPDTRYSSRSGEAAYNAFLDKQLKANVWDSGYYSVAESLYPLLLAMMVVVLPFAKVTEAALIFAIIDLIQRSISPIKNIAGKITNIQRAMTGLQRIDEFVDHLEKSQPANDSPESSDKNRCPVCKIQVAIEHFAYPVRKETEQSSFSLEEIHFEAEQGQLIGVVGPSGHGKSTLLKILAGELLPGRGYVRLIGRDQSEVVLAQGKGHDQYRHNVSIVSQESHVFTETLIFNITLSVSEETEDFENFWEWVKLKIPYVNKWRFKPDEVIRPDLLSAGEKQLISAVRSLYLKRPVVLFDEISSAMDSELELALRKAVLLVQQQSLTFIVAHRLETIRQADKILVIKNGRLESSGRHGELSNSSNSYQEFLKEMSP